MNEFEFVEQDFVSSRLIVDVDAIGRLSLLVHDFCRSFNAKEFVDTFNRGTTCFEDDLVICS